MGPFDVQAQGRVACCEAQTALQAGVRLHGGVDHHHQLFHLPLHYWQSQFNDFLVTSD
tara:strand:- start:1251 stop:1424 length:174 start_codon:yes stop_codon:yes gene_type:complete